MAGRGLVRILVAYLTACTIATAFILEGVGYWFSTRWDPWWLRQVTVWFFLFGLGVVVSHTMLPTAAVAWFAPRSVARSPIWSAVFGGIICAVGYGAYAASVAAMEGASNSRWLFNYSEPGVLGNFWTVVAAGVCGGFVFWAIAGRSLQTNRADRADT